MFKKSKVLFIPLLLLVTLAPSLAGCTVNPDAYSGDPNVNPFYTDRVATVRIVMDESDWQALMANAFSKEYFKADFWFDDELVPDVAIRTKGNASLQQTMAWQSDRFPLAIDFNLFNKARSFHGMKKVHFNNGWSDPTLLRDVISYDIFAKMGVPSPRASIVDLYVNDHRLGVYTMAEAVDSSFLSRYFTDTSGNLYKPEVSSARLDWTEKNAYTTFKMYSMFPSTPVEQDLTKELNLGGGPLWDILNAMGDKDTGADFRSENATADFSSLMIRNFIEGVGLKNNQTNPDHTDLFRLLDVLNNSSDADFPQEIEKVLDVDEALRFLAVSAGIVHLDNYIGIGHNTYLYDNNGKFTIIPWDLNMTFGTFNGGIRKDGIINFYIDEPTTGPVSRFPLVDRLLSYQPYLDKYHQYLQELIDGPMSLDVILPRVDQLADLIRPYVKTDTESFYTYEDWERCLTEDLRPPDAFEGWEAGGQSPSIPFYLSPKESMALRQNFGVNSLYELMFFNYTPGNLLKLKNSVTDAHYHTFLQAMYGPLEAPQPPRQPGFGPNSLGLKSIIKARWESIRQQLSGERPSRGIPGLGNGGSMWMADMYVT